jgi:hypothetical protein
MTDETFEERLEKQIRKRVEEELARARVQRERHREEAGRQREERARRDDREHVRFTAGVHDTESDAKGIPLPDVDKVGELLEIVADKIPALLGGLRDLLYSPQAAENMADSVATFYVKLKEAGIPEEQALDMARNYMFNLRDVLGKKGLDLGRLTRDDD